MNIMYDCPIWKPQALNIIGGVSVIMLQAELVWDIFAVDTPTLKRLTLIVYQMLVFVVAIR